MEEIGAVGFSVAVSAFCFEDIHSYTPGISWDDMLLR
jgi:hypothetical protein